MSGQLVRLSLRPRLIRIGVDPGPQLAETGAQIVVGKLRDEASEALEQGSASIACVRLGRRCGRRLWPRRTEAGEPAGEVDAARSEGWGIGRGRLATGEIAQQRPELGEQLRHLVGDLAGLELADISAAHFPDVADGRGEFGGGIARRFRVVHLDNPATHLGLDTVEQLAAKYEQSVENFGRVVRRHPHVVSTYPSYKAARFLKRAPGLPAFRGWFKRLALSASLPVKARAFSLRLYRAALYAEAV